MSEQNSLKDRLQADLKASMKAKDKVRKNTITMIRAEILQHEKDEQIKLDDAGVTDVLSHQLKQRRDSLADFKKGGREDLIEQTEAEIAVIEGYLPKQLSEEEITANKSEIRDARNENVKFNFLCNVKRVLRDPLILPKHPKNAQL